MCPEFEPSHFERYVEKLCTVNLAAREGEGVLCTSDSIEWLKMDPPDRGIYLYRHPANVIHDAKLSRDLLNHRTIREAEKCVSRVADGGWFFLDEFLKGVFIPLNESHMISLERKGRHWKYELPRYSEMEMRFFTAVIKQWLFEAGITALGTKDGRECFCLTPLGQNLFGDE